MADIDLIKRNLTKMVDAGAPEADLDAYLASEGFKSADEWRAASAGAKNTGAPTAGGVQDWEPSQQPTEPTIGERINRGVNWLGTRITKAGTALAGTPHVVSQAIDMLPSSVRRAAPILEIPRAVGGALPSREQMDEVVFRDLKVPEVDSSGPVGKMVDKGVEAVVPLVVMPGSFARNMLPAFVGGAGSEAAGKITEGTQYEPWARVLAGVGLGTATALGQNLVGNVVQGVKNALAPNVNESAAKIVARAIERDRTTGNALADAQKANPGSMIVENAGPNVRGALRGSTAAPGKARTVAQDAFDTRLEGTNARTTSALDSAVSPNGNLASTVDDLATARSAASGPAYEAAGIPRSRADLPKADRLMMSDDLLELFDSSPDVQAALRNARRVPELKNQPINSMAVLDRVYKHLGGIERQAKSAGNNVKAGDIADIRKRVGAAIDAENPAYGNALATYSEPSKLIDASNKGREWFAKNVDPVLARREFTEMSPDEQQSALIGIRDWARTTIGKSDRGTAAERVWAGGNNRERFEAILGPDAFKKLKGIMESEKNLIKTQRDVGVGSRTIPMGLEAADNAMETVSPLTDLMRGNVLSAAGKFGGRVAGRIAEGRTEATNARIAEILSSTDPKEVGLVAALLEQERRRQLATAAARRNALAIGGATAPGINALSGGL